MIQNKIYLIVTCCLLCFLQSGCNKKEPGKVKPNIIVILSDDLGYSDPVCYGGTKLKTPNIDKLASEGVLFTNGYAPASVCSPSRYALLTGEYAWRKKVNILPGDAPMSIAPDRLTMPMMMQKCGYITGITGKWHLGLGIGNVDFNKLIKPSPNDIGFDYSYIYPATNDRVPCVYIEDGKVVGLEEDDPIQVNYKEKVGDWPTGRENPELLTLKSLKGHDNTIVNGIGRIGFMCGGTNALWKDETMAEVFTGKTVDFIRKNSDKPFFLYFPTHSIHEPRVPGPNFKGSSECGVYGDVIQELDWSVGEILKTLKEQGIDNNTLIVFLSDNGPRVEEGYADGGKKNLNGHITKGLLRGDKGTIFEGGTRTPFIVRWPDKISPKSSDAPVEFIDLFASFANLLGFELPEGQAPDSRDAMDALMGKAPKTKHDELVIQDHRGKLALRSGKWKYIPKESLPQGSEDELYNLDDDISEKINLAGKHPDILKKLSFRLSEIKSNPGVRQ